MKILLCGAGLAILVATPTFADTLENKPACEELIALFIVLAEKSGETVSNASAQAEVMSENPSDAECAAMLALFPRQE
ncbi:hypothetical protein [uncultured Tateyamaria sp.]|uniref:hypothetical protein n=1 Tax=Tateyamaria sp. 1078 TaxID=3417464 RepID=UPI0026230BD5|nr:hypothetical protein [uncultured Tateyamaria sp.]